MMPTTQCNGSEAGQEQRNADRDYTELDQICVARVPSTTIPEMVMKR